MTPHEIAEQLSDWHEENCGDFKPIIGREGSCASCGSSFIAHVMRNSAQALRTLEAEKAQAEQERDAARRAHPTMTLPVETWLRTSCVQHGANETCLEAETEPCAACSASLAYWEDQHLRVKARQLTEQLASAQQQIADLTTKVGAFISQWEKAEGPINSAITIATIHGVPYDGPGMHDELRALRALLPAPSTDETTKD